MVVGVPLYFLNQIVMHRVSPVLFETTIDRETYRPLTLGLIHNSCLERVAGDAHPTFHQHAGAAAHDRLGHAPVAVLLRRFRTDPQRAGRVAEAHSLTRTD